jgi:FeS assembly SUF system regulator
MFRLSRMTDYGIVLMTQLARRSATRCARDVAAAAHIPHPVASKLLKQLAREGLLVSQRGPGGGYGLARDASQISVAEMVAALEGPIGLTECSAHPGACVQESACHVREPWQRINRVVRDALEHVTLADLANPAAIPVIAHFDPSGRSGAAGSAAPTGPRQER